LGRTGLEVPGLCIGTSAIGSIPRIYGYEVGVDQALETLRAVFACPIRFVDTSNSYGGGESERRIGAVLRELGGLPPGFVLSTKVDPDVTGDFSGNRVRRSLDESCERLGMDFLPLVHLHDPERISFAEATAPGGPVDPAAHVLDELVDPPRGRPEPDGHVKLAVDGALAPYLVGDPVLQLLPDVGALVHGL
jgi:D-threo-aldose 1-dehydrogenase